MLRMAPASSGRHSLFRRIFPLMVLMVILGGALLSVAMVRTFHGYVSEFHAQIVAQKARVAAQSMRLYVEELSTRSFLLSQSPLLGALNADAVDQARLRQILAAVAANSPMIEEALLLLQVGEQRLVLRAGVAATLADEADFLQRAWERPAQDLVLLPGEPGRLQASAPFSSDDFSVEGRVLLRSAIAPAFAEFADSLMSGEWLLLYNRATGLLSYPLGPPTGEAAQFDIAQSLRRGEPVTEQGLRLSTVELPESSGHGGLVLGVLGTPLATSQLLRNTVHTSLQVQLALIVVFMLLSYLASRHVAAPIAGLRRSLAERREQIGADDLPPNADSDLVALFHVIVDNAARIREQQRGLATRMQNLIQMQAELNTAYLQLKQSDAEKDELVKVTAHDLREPLLVVKSCGALLPELIEEDDRVGLERTLGYIDDSIDRMAMQLERMRRYFRIGSRREVETIDLEALVQGIFREQIEAGRAQPEELVCGGEAVLQGYRDDVEILLQHLLDNAIRYRRDHAPLHVRVRLRREEEGCVIEVCDNGIGIDPERSESLFRLFARRDASSRMRGHGTSLAECRKITGLHEGQIGVRSNPGAGVTFRVLLRDRRAEGGIETLPREATATGRRDLAREA